jgi:hypothetical protein
MLSMYMANPYGGNCLGSSLYMYIVFLHVNEAMKENTAWAVC